MNTPKHLLRKELANMINTFRNPHPFTTKFCKSDENVAQVIICYHISKASLIYWSINFDKTKESKSSKKPHTNYHKDVEIKK